MNLGGDWFNIALGAPLGLGVLLLVVTAWLTGRLYSRAAVKDLKEGFEERLREARQDRDYYREIALRSLKTAERTVSATENVVPLIRQNGG